MGAVLGPRIGLVERDHRAEHRARAAVCAYFSSLHREQRVLVRALLSYQCPRYPFANMPSYVKWYHVRGDQRPQETFPC